MSFLEVMNFIEKIEWTSFKNNNLSPYSSFISKKYVVQKFDDLENRMNNFYSKVSKKI